MTMKRFRNNIFTTVAITFIVAACYDLDELNINPNGADPEVADLNLLMPTVITQVGQSVVDLGWGDIAGVMQHTQRTGWSSSHNDYDWNNDSKSWSGYYGILRNADELYNKAVAGKYEFHQAVAMIMKAYVFGMIADLWGDAPYSQAMRAEEGSQFYQPVFDPQRDIYRGILSELDSANTLLSKEQDAYDNINKVQDVLYGGDVLKWRRFANSLALRYYMRLSVKDPDFAKEGIEKITMTPGYPVMEEASDDANVDYGGTSASDSWPSNTVYDIDPVGNYQRTKMCQTLVDAMQALKDPRLRVWANAIETPLVLVPGSEIDRIENGQRLISQDVVDAYMDAWGVGLDFDADYVGIPPSVFAAPQYNLNPNLEQGAYNPHVSNLDSMYMEASGPLLKMRLLSSSEVHLILAEASLYGWTLGMPQDHYARGVRQSLVAWGVGAAFDQYIQDAPYTGLESIIQQKWIGSWTAAAEAWFDYRRTGLPDLKTGESAKRAALPLRFYYHFSDEIAKNPLNAEAAINRLEPTPYKGTDVSNNSAWSRTWLLQGTGKPY